MAIKTEKHTVYHIWHTYDIYLLQTFIYSEHMYAHKNV